MSDKSDLEDALELFFAAARTFRKIGSEIEHAILFAPEDESRFTVMQAIRFIERYNMKINGFVLEQKAEEKSVCIVYGGKARWLPRRYFSDFMDDIENDHG